MRARFVEINWLSAGAFACLAALLAAKIPAARITGEAAALKTENAANEAVRMIADEASSARSGEILLDGLRLVRADGMAISFVVEKGVLKARQDGAEIELLEGVEAARFRPEDRGRFVGAEIVVRDAGSPRTRTLHARIPWIAGDRAPSDGLASRKR